MREREKERERERERKKAREEERERERERERARERKKGREEERESDRGMGRISLTSVRPVSVNAILLGILPVHLSSHIVKHAGFVKAWAGHSGVLTGDRCRRDERSYNTKLV